MTTFTHTTAAPFVRAEAVHNGAGRTRTDDPRLAKPPPQRPLGTPKTVRWTPILSAKTGMTSHVKTCYTVTKKPGMGRCQNGMYRFAPRGRPGARCSLPRVLGVTPREQPPALHSVASSRQQRVVSAQRGHQEPQRVGGQLERSAEPGGAFQRPARVV